MMTETQKEQYEQNRLKKLQLERQFQAAWIATIVLGAFLFFLILFCGVHPAKDPDVTGAAKFYHSIAHGAGFLLLSVATFVLGFFAASKRPMPALVLIGIFLVHMVFGMVSNATAQSYGFFLPDLFGIVLYGWTFLRCREYQQLSEQPGFPHFSVSVEESSEYVAPLYVTQRTASSQMEEITAPGDPTVAQPQQTETPEIPALPAPSPDIVLEEMDANLRPAPQHDALPNPEEVRARLRAMRQSRIDAENKTSES